MAWYEVKKINRNFLKQTIDSKIKEIANLLANHFSKRKTEEDRYNNEIQNTVVNLHGASKIIKVGDGVSNKVIEITGKGKIEFFAQMDIANGRRYDSTYGNIGLTLCRAFAMETSISIDGESESKQIFASTIYFDKSLKMTVSSSSAYQYDGSNGLLLFALVTLY